MPFHLIIINVITAVDSQLFDPQSSDLGFK